MTVLQWHCKHAAVDACPEPEGRFYDNDRRLLIHDWQQADRDQVMLEWQAERRALHSLGEPHGTLTGHQGAISKDISRGLQPLFSVEYLELSDINQHPIARVRMSFSHAVLFVDLADCLKPLSKNSKRKVSRYGKQSPEAERSIRAAVYAAVRDYMTH